MSAASAAVPRAIAAVSVTTEKRLVRDCIGEVAGFVETAFRFR
jgi:hypothetical protein